MCGWVTSHPLGQALFAPSTSMKPVGPVGLASHIGTRPLAVPNPLGVVGMSAKAARWECALGQKTWARDIIFNLIIHFPLLDGIPSVLGGLAGQWHSRIPHGLPQPQLWG